MKTAIRFKFVAFALACAMLAASAPVALALPPLPSSFWGTVKMNGANAPNGTVVSAWINGVRYAQATVSVYNGDTVYSLDVPGDDPQQSGIQGGVPGDTVVFQIETWVAQTAPWQSGINAELDLYIDVATVGLAPATSTRISPGAIATHTLTLTNPDSVFRTFSFTGTNNLQGWNVLVPGPLQLNASASGNVVITVSIAVTATNRVTDTATLTATSPGLLPGVTALLTGTGCRYDFTGDNWVRYQDVQRVAFYVNTTNPYYDFNHNGWVRYQDVQRAAYFAGTYCP
jgi:hypothetical protein